MTDDLNKQNYIFELQTRIRNLEEDKLRLYAEIDRIKARVLAVINYK